jgi:hypothetical protein
MTATRTTALEEARRKRVFIGLCEIAGYNSALKLGFDEIGVDSTFIELNSHQFKFRNCQLDNAWIRLIKFFGDRRVATTRKNLIRKIFWILCQQATTIPLFIWALFRFDVFVFGFGESFFRLWDLPLLRLLGKRIICIFYGSESRPPYINGKYADLSPEELAKLTEEFKRRVVRIEKYAHFIINHPPTGHFHEKPFVQYMAVGIPAALEIPFKGIREHDPARPVRILHAPSHTTCKGTDRIRTAIESLKEKGYAIEYVEVMNQPNAVVIRELQECDFVVDELYSDAVMAGFATEAAFCGKPAVVGGYVRLDDLGGLGPEEIPPVFHCHPDKVEGAIEKLISDPEERLRLGESARQFVLTRWTARSVAERYVHLIADDVPADWYFDPREITYLHGWGMRDAEVQGLIQELLDRCGTDALQLRDKPVLQERFVSFANKAAA